MFGKWRLRAGLLFYELKKPTNVVIAILAAAFLIIWGLNWQYDSDESRWFDSLGHAIAGFGGALSLRYLIRKYGAKGFFVFDEGRRFLTIIVEAWVMRIAIFWEVLEFSWDVIGQPYVVWFIRAQKDSIDTMSDIIIAVVMAKIALALTYWYDCWYEKKYPNESEYEETEDVISMVRRVSQSKKIRRRAVRRQRIEKIIGFFKEELDKIGDKFKDDKDDEH